MGILKRFTELDTGNLRGRLKFATFGLPKACKEDSKKPGLEKAIAKLETISHEIGHLLMLILNEEDPHKIWISPFGPNTTRSLGLPLGVIIMRKGLKGRIEEILYPFLFNNSIEEIRNLIQKIRKKETEEIKISAPEDLNELIKNAMIILAGIISECISTCPNDTEYIYLSFDKAIIDITIDDDFCIVKTEMDLYLRKNKPELSDEERLDLMNKMFQVIAKETIQLFQSKPTSKLVRKLSHYLLKNSNMQRGLRTSLTDKMIKFTANEGIDFNEIQALYAQMLDKVSQEIEELTSN